MITVYTQPGCGPCIWLKCQLEKNAVPHELVDITTAEGARGRLESLGAMGTPYLVNEATGEHWKYDPADPERGLHDVAPPQGSKVVPTQIVLGTDEYDETAAHWNPLEQGAVMILGQDEAARVGMQRYLVEEAVARGWHVQVLAASPGRLTEALATEQVQPFSDSPADQVTQLEQLRQLLELRFAQHEARALADAAADAFEPMMLVVDDLEDLRVLWSHLPGGREVVAAADLSLATLVEYGRKVGIYTVVNLRRRQTALLGQDRHLLIATTLTDGIADEWAAEEIADVPGQDKHGGRGSAVLRAEGHEPQIVRLCSSPAEVLSHAG